MIVKAKRRGIYKTIVCYSGAIFEIEENRFDPAWMLKEEDLIRESEIKETENA